ncbi:MAG TPA: competence protein CoiA family protein [Candidatus Competibacter sp.]|nr:competence protein CoiA family protein [Candidatus Competibacter sp.]
MPTSRANPHPPGFDSSPEPRARSTGYARWLLAHEVQLSSITVEEISERTNDYRKAGIDVHWWLGGAGNSEAVNEWCRREYGGSFILDYRKASEHIALYETLKNSIG